MHIEQLIVKIGDPVWHRLHYGVCKRQGYPFWSVSDGQIRQETLRDILTSREIASISRYERGVSGLGGKPNRSGSMSRIQRRVGGFVNKCLFQDTILEVEISLAYVDEQAVVPAAKQLGTLYGSKPSPHPCEAQSATDRSPVHTSPPPPML